MHEPNINNLGQINTCNLGKLYDDAGELIGVEYVLFEGRPNFRVAIILRFAAFPVYFMANPDYDTIHVAFNAPRPEPEHQLVTVSKEFPWQEACGRSVCWAWSMVNQQGYADGVRLEFSNPNEKDSVFIEMVVAASSIDWFTCVSFPQLG